MFIGYVAWVGLHDKSIQRIRERVSGDHAGRRMPSED
jgi:hypothetical protein